MSARQLLDQLLQSGQGLLSDATNRVQGATGGSTGGKGSFLTGLGGGALGAGALGLLMGSKKARKIGGKVAMYGGMAALGALAYRAYGDWQRNQAGGAQAAPPQTLDRLPAPEAEQHSNAVLTAMIGAAKADGHIGPEERGLLETELAKLSSDAQDRQWLETELSRPLDPAAVAQSAKTPEMAAEMYLASLLVVDEESYMERAYLDELARQLRLEPGLKEKLEQHAKSAVA
ncbi:tellurite resistance TerB family protein [Achromobacter spanius]|uniref:Tellurite resistance TerB family protein n=1 Tax=Achromobacter spanius TaxID=217203 RepID=A0AA42LLA5_9BURK|nr:tellurite resistance TerB family protein [Achromobacter spanius]MDH0736154.1 tellurite resistance TerB family protein [Achromobacter spanius]